MHSGNLQFSGALLFVSVFSLLFSNLTYAAPACSNFLTKSEVPARSDNPLEELLIQIEQAGTLQEANNLTYDLMVLGNSVFDQAIDGITALNQNVLNKKQADLQKARVQILVNALQNAFRIPSYVMGFAITNRLEIEGAEFATIQRREQRKRAIGFAREEAAKDFHADPPANQPIGFGIKDPTAEEKDRGNLLFARLMTRLKVTPLDEKSAHKRQKDKEVAADESNDNKIPLGFITPTENALGDDSKPLDQIGFVQPEKKEDFFDRNKVNQIVLNIQAGEFRIPEDQSKIPVGFETLAAE